MPSLLELMIQNRRPRGGLLGQGAPPEASPLAALSGANSASGGGEGRPLPPVSLLSQEEQDALRSEQLTTLGLGILSSDPSRGAFSRIAEGALLSRELGQDRREDLLRRKIDLQELAIELREEQRDRRLDRFRGQVFSDADLSDPHQRTQVMGKLLAAGDFEGAQRLNQFEANLPEARPVENGGEIILYDLRTLERKGTIQTPEERPEGTEVIDRGTRSDLIDSNTGDVIASFSHGLPPEELRERQDTIFKRTDKLADDFRSETKDLQGSLRLGADSLEAPEDDPAAQQTLVIALNKLLDPGSVVRQSEFARVQEIGGFRAEAQTFANRLAREGQLPPEVEQSLRDEISRLLEAKQADLGQIAEQFKERAQAFGINPEFVVRRGLQEDVGLMDEEDEQSENPFID